VSRDGKRITYEIADSKESSIWIYDLSGATSPGRLTLPGSGSNRYPIWSPNGEWVAFQSDREGDLGIWRQHADGNGAAERLTKAEKGESHIPDSWSPDGQFISFTLAKGTTTSGMATVWTLSLRDRKTTLFADAPAAWSSFSPVDVHWLAYSADNHVFVRPFPSGVSKYQAPQVRTDHHTLWSPDGKELFYESGNQRLVTVSVIPRPGSSLGFGAPMESSSGFFTHAVNYPRSFDILPNGKQFIGFVYAGSAGSAGSAGAATPQLQVVLNWFEEVKQRLPVK
jgi:Tol biopolymer transport system component